MSQRNLEDTQNLLRSIQKAMMAKSSTVRGQWNSITLLEKISQVQFARRLNVFGITASNIEVAQLFYYLGIKQNSLGFNEFMTLMETDPASLGPKSRRLMQSKDIEHETLRSYEDDLNKYCRRTTTLTPSSQTRNTFASDLTQKSTRKITRPFTTSTAQIPKSSRRQKNAIKTNAKRSNANYDDESNYAANNKNQYDESQYYNDDDHQNLSGVQNGSVTFSYEPCKTILERSLPRDRSTKQAREATLRSFSNTSIQRQYYDATDPSKFTREDGTPVKELVTQISDIAYTAWPNSWTCFLKWRDPHHDLLDANDLRNGLKHDNNLVISQAEAQRVIDAYGGPMNHSTFAVMLHDGSHFNPNNSIHFGDD